MKRKILLLLFCVLLFSSAILPTYAASYELIPRLSSGYGVSYDLGRDKLMETTTIVKLDNSGGAAPKTWTSTVTNTEQSSFTGTLGTEISAEVSLKATAGVGTIGGGLAGKLYTEFSYNYARTISRTETIKITAPAGKRIQEVAKTYGRDYNTYARKFILYVISWSKNGHVNVPEYMEYISSSY